MPPCIGLSLIGCAKEACRPSYSPIDESWLVTRKHVSLYTGWAKNGTIFVRFITSPNVNRFSKIFHCQNQETIRNETVTIDPTTPQVCCYTPSWNVRWRTKAGDATDQVTGHSSAPKRGSGRVRFCVGRVESPKIDPRPTLECMGTLKMREMKIRDMKMRHQK